MTSRSNRYFTLASPPSNSTQNSMSQGFHEGMYSFSDGTTTANQSRREKLGVQQAFDASGNPTLLPIEDGDQEVAIYERVTPTSALSDMFNFAAGGPTATELLAGQISRTAQIPADWYGANRQGGLLPAGSSPNLSSLHQAALRTADPAAAMQLFLTNPNQPSQPPSQSTAAPPPPPPPSLGGPHHSFAVVEGGGQGLSLTLSSSLQQYNMLKGEDVVDDRFVYFASNDNDQSHINRRGGEGQHGHHNSMQLQGHGVIHGRQSTATTTTMANLLRNSRYVRPARELLEELCSVGREKLKGGRIGKSWNAGLNSNNFNSNNFSSAGASSSSSKEVPPLSPADRFEHQRKKAKLISMIDEVDRRYSHYCDQMQMVVNSFDSIMGIGAATPYTALAQRAMSRHFRCLKDAIAAQLKKTCELLGEKESASSSGITKGDTPRLRALDQSLRQQRAFHQMGMVEQEAWRPQRGLPERSVTLLRAWLFEHFLNPYPSDADKHLLARQTGLSRNQVSNWFINARVRLWKPMIEEMYQQEFKDDSDEPSEGTNNNNQRPQSPTQQQVHRPESNPTQTQTNWSVSSSSQVHVGTEDNNDVLIGGIDALADPQANNMFRYGTGTTMRFGAPTGDISLTLGLRHAGGNASGDKSRFSVRDFEAL